MTDKDDGAGSMSIEKLEAEVIACARHREKMKEFYGDGTFGMSFANVVHFGACWKLVEAEREKQKLEKTPFKISREWCQKMGEVEDGMDIAAGGPNHPLRLPRPEITDSEDNPSEAPSNPGSKEAVAPTVEELREIEWVEYRKWQLADVAEIIQQGVWRRAKEARKAAVEAEFHNPKESGDV